MANNSRLKIVQKLVLLLCLRFFLISSAHSQVQDSIVFGTKILYEYTFQSDSTDGNSRKKLEMELLLSESQQLALFQSSAKHLTDSNLFQLAKKMGPNSKLGVISVQISPINPNNYQIIQTPGSVTTIDPLNGMAMDINNEFYKYEDELSDIKWKLSSDTSTVNGIKCQKAELDFGGRNWIAWFAEEIPISYGPYKFLGLPGLIVKIYDVQEFFSFELLSIIPDSRSTVYFNIRPDLKIVPISKNDFFRNRKILRDNMYEMAIAKGVNFGQRDLDARQQTKEIAKKDNNHIEKY